MQISIYHVDTFTNKLFAGNPGAVCLLPEWIADETMKQIAIENHLPVTAFLVRGDDAFAIRWITPDYELDLCGHGTLASAFVIFNYLEPDFTEVNFQSKKAGLLTATREDDWITLHFPVKTMERIEATELLIKGLGATPKEVYKHQDERLLVVFDDENKVKNLQPDFITLRQIEQRGIVATAASKEVDFVSRTFYPRKTLTEDAVTGASHCMLVPYWAKHLGKEHLVARQISKRGGELRCELHKDHVRLSSRCVLYSQGKIEL